LTVTELARNKVLDVMESQGRLQDALRVMLTHGGTAMAEFGLQFVADEDIPEDAAVVDGGGFRVVIDRENLPFLEGATIDYVEGLHESGFKVDAPNARPPKPSGPVADKIVEVIETRINPAIASHGGFVVLEGLKNDVAYLRFGGGCQGCGMINVTLKQGVEVMIKESVPEIAAVMDVTDHDSGQNPYYRPSK